MAFLIGVGAGARTEFECASRYGSASSGLIVKAIGTVMNRRLGDRASIEKTSINIEKFGTFDNRLRHVRRKKSRRKWKRSHK